jgi:hypothetical protein
VHRTDSSSGRVRSGEGRRSLGAAGVPGEPGALPVAGVRGRRAPAVQGPCAPCALPCVGGDSDAARPCGGAISLTPLVCHLKLSPAPGRARQDPHLAKEPFWVHATTAPEQGGLLLARPRCAAILDPRYHQVRQRLLCRAHAKYPISVWSSRHRVCPCNGSRTSRRAMNGRQLDCAVPTHAVWHRTGGRGARPVHLLWCLVSAWTTCNDGR